MVAHVASMVEVINAYRLWLENQKRRNHYEDLSADGNTLLELVIVTSSGKT